MSWDQLIAVLTDGRRAGKASLDQPPVACPNDGAILDIRSDNRRNCPMGDYTWPYFLPGQGTKKNIF